MLGLMADPNHAGRDASSGWTTNYFIRVRQRRVDDQWPVRRRRRNCSADGDTHYVVDEVP